MGSVHEKNGTCKRVLTLVQTGISIVMKSIELSLKRFRCQGQELVVLNLLEIIGIGFGDHLCVSTAYLGSKLVH